MHIWRHNNCDVNHYRLHRVSYNNKQCIESPSESDNVQINHEVVTGVKTTAAVFKVRSIQQNEIV